MLRVRALIAVAATAALVTLCEAQFGQPGGGFGQPGGFGKATPATPTPLAVLLLNGIDDPGVVAELKLSDEQVKKLVARRQEVWDEAYTSVPKTYSEGARARADATDSLLKKTLTEAQYNRAVQLAAQYLLGDGGFRSRPDDLPTFSLTTITATTLTRYPELVVAFKLTDDQKKQLAPPAVPGGAEGENPFSGSFGRSVTLNADQVAAAKDFLGPVFTKPYVLKRDRRLDQRPAQPEPFRLLAAQDVRAELKLTDDQAKEFAAIREKWTKLTADRRTDLSPKDADAQGMILVTESEKAVAALKPEQATRLKQIAYRENGLGRHIEDIYTDPTAVKELALNEKQTADIAAAHEAFQKAAVKVFESAASFADTEKKIEALVAERRRKAEAVVTADQQAKLKTLIGEPFTGSTLPDSLRGDRGDRGEPFVNELTPIRRAATFGKYSGEFTQLATNKSIQDELKLTEEQIKQATTTRDEIATKFTLPRLSSANPTPYVKAVADRSEAIAAALGKLLKADQAKRFREIMIQARDRRTDPRGGFATTTTGVLSAVAYPGVAEAVKLTDDQKKKLVEGNTAESVLTDDQKKEVAKLMGEPFKGNFTLPGGFGPVPGGGGAPGGVSPTLQLLREGMFGKYSAEFTQLAGNKSIQDELKMTEEQVKKAAETRDDIQSKFRLTFPTADNTDAFQKSVADRSKAVEEGLGKVLTADQAKRFREIMLQSRNQPTAKGGFATSLTSPVAYPGVAEAVKLTDDQKKKILGGTAADEVLTADQKTAITKMLGEPFKGTFTTPFPGGFAPGGGGIGGVGTPAPALTPLLRVLTLRDKTAADSLKLTDDQSKTITPALEEYRKVVQEVGGGGFGRAADRNQRLTAAIEAFDKATAGVLTQAQQKRISQIRWQLDAATNLSAALADARPLELTDDQKAKIAALWEEAVRLQSLMVRHIQVADEQSLALRMRDAADERILTVLTDAQKAKWKELTGETLPGLRKSIPFDPRGGRGGFGPPGSLNP